MSGERPALLGRERHLRELRVLVEGVSAARGHLVVFSGEAGAGKTRLTEDAATLATDAGVAVAWTGLERRRGAYSMAACTRTTTSSFRSS
jgi:hypothetical protein